MGSVGGRIGCARDEPRILFSNLAVARKFCSYFTFAGRLWMR